MNRFSVKYPCRFTRRLENDNKSEKKHLRKVLSFIYGKTNNCKKKSINLCAQSLNPNEIILAKWLANKVTGKGRRYYGSKAVKAAKKAKYKCEKCNLSDIRCLDIHHVENRSIKIFQCLCANCHKIITRETQSQNLNLKSRKAITTR